MEQPPQEWENLYQTEEPSGKWKKFLWIVLIISVVLAFMEQSSYWPEIKKWGQEDITRIKQLVTHQLDKLKNKVTGSNLQKEKEPWKMYFKQGTAAMRHRKYRQAEGLLRKSLIQGKKSGAGTVELMSAQKAMAEVLRSQHRWNEAEAFYKLVLKNAEGVYGSEHPKLIRHLMDLNEIYLTLEHYNKLEPNYIRIIAIDEKIHGPDHPIVASNLNSLARLYSKHLYRLEDAESLYKRALTIWESKSGSISKGAMNSIKGLIKIYRIQGRIKELAELEDSLEKRQQEVAGIKLKRGKIPRKLHPRVVKNPKTMAKLADFYDSSLRGAPLWLRYTETGYKAYKKGKRKDAEDLLLAALYELEPLENAEASRLTRILNPLSMNYYRLGRYKKAKIYFELMVQAYGKAHGVHHTSVGTSLNNLGYICQKLKQYADAEKYFNKAIALYEENGKPDDPMIAHSLEGLATVYLNQGRDSEVSPLYKRAISIWEKREGRNGKNSKRIKKNISR